MPSERIWIHAETSIVGALIEVPLGVISNRGFDAPGQQVQKVVRVVRLVELRPDVIIVPPRISELGAP